MDEKERTEFFDQTEFSEFGKWLKYLLYTRLAGTVLSVLALIPGISTVVRWVSGVFAAATVYILFRMANGGQRYRTAAILNGVILLSNLLAQNVLAMVISICSIAAMYQEYTGHSELTQQLDPVLSGKWHSLFYWHMAVGLISGFAASAGVMIGVFAQANKDVLVSGIIFVLTAAGLLLEVIYLNCLSRTRKLFSE